ncbi:MAG: DUF1287 domain-containing protein [Desulfobulbaceae bacterium]|nr:DUF1287 domain-containing protein [Desulfobulbaceae bacterium]
MKKYLFFIILFVTLILAPHARAGHEKEFVQAARGQIGKTIFYDPAYRILNYPNGDVPLVGGVCTDVVIRALRAAYEYDLQKVVHEDMRENFARYPRIWGLKGPDKNIDHRRVPNLQTFFKRKGWDLPLTSNRVDFQPGDIVTCIVPPHLPHIMIISDRKNVNHIPLVIHNIGSGTREEDRLLDFELTGHYRMSEVE